MKILITGSNGFIGKNLVKRLEQCDDIEMIFYNKENTIDELTSGLLEADKVVHLAGVNRTENSKDFFDTNSDLTLTITDILTSNNHLIPIAFSSSIQATLDNDYGKSKKLAEDRIIKYGNKSIVFRFHNVFGKWCKPNYNSVIATFCNNIANDLDIQINDESKTIDFIYIDDVVKEIMNFIYDKTGEIEHQDNYYYVNPKYNVSLGEIVCLLRSFRNNETNIMVPNIGDPFTKKLYSTYISYVPLKRMAADLVDHTDERGTFCELVRTSNCGQVSISTTKAGVPRGNHYHDTKIERFVVVKGKARIDFESIIDGTTYTFEVNGDHLQFVTIPVGYSHSINNIGDDELVLFIWCNELFDEKNPDTYVQKKGRI